MSPDQMSILIDIVSEATRTIGWIAGLFVGLFSAIIGGSVALIMKLFSNQIKEIAEATKESNLYAKTISETVANNALHCREYRKICNEKIAEKYIDKQRAEDIDHRLRDELRSGIKALEECIRHEVSAINNRLDGILETRKEFWSRAEQSIEAHMHDEEGSVIFRKEKPTIRRQ